MKNETNNSRDIYNIKTFYCDSKTITELLKEIIIHNHTIDIIKE